MLRHVVTQVLGGDVSGVVKDSKAAEFKKGDRVIALTFGYHWDYNEYGKELTPAPGASCTVSKTFVYLRGLHSASEGALPKPSCPSDINMVRLMSCIDGAFAWSLPCTHVSQT